MKSSITELPAKVLKLLKWLSSMVRLAGKAFGSPYRFSLRDIQLYLKETSCILPIPYTAALNPWHDNETTIITINGLSIHFPSLINPNDLPWLWHEVFDPFSANPSSYDHHRINYANLKWIIDAGAAEGYFSLFCAERVSRATQIIALEPLPIMTVSLSRTFIMNKAYNCIICPAAIGNENTELIIEQDPSHICDSKITSGPQPSNESKVRTLATVDCTTIDDLSRRFNLYDRGLIKMDIEGFEMMALQGATNLLMSHKPFLAIAVYHEYRNALECADIIRRANPSYTIEFRGYYGYFTPPRPYLLFAY